jgi:acetylornithine deacetylase/succinyl-diaminopimelate desuccinylase-like protein
MIMAFDGIPEDELEGRFDLLISIDEEVSSRGVRTCIEQGYRCDYAIVGEPTRLAPVTAHSGLMFLDVWTPGIGGHGSRPWEGRSAVLDFMDLYHDLEDLVKGFPSHPLVGNSSVNLGVISAGDATNRIPVSCDGRLDIRVMPGMTVSEALTEIEKLVLDRGSTLGVFKRGDPFEIMPDSTLLETVEKVEDEVLDARNEPAGMRGWTEADPFRNMACADSLVLGPGDIGRAHTENELVSLDQVERAAEIYLGVARRLVGKES